jgi:hypothetical protein
MQTGYFILLLIGFAWLALWSVQAKLPNKKGWWPFDMRADLDSLADAAPTEAMPGRRRGVAITSRTVPPPGNPMSHAPHAAAPATAQAAWRQRRDLPGNRRPGR